VVEKGGWQAADARVEIGRIHARRGERAAARAEFLEALDLLRKLRLSEAPALLELGAHEFSGGRFEDASGWYRLAREASPSSPNAVFFLGVSLQRAGRVAEAWPLYGEAMRLLARAGRTGQRTGLSVADCHKQMGLAAEELGRFGEAVEHFGKVLELDPSHPERARIEAEIARLKGLIRSPRD
jgi:tetratricopeptide (TPR) repeat protein